MNRLMTGLFLLLICGEVNAHKPSDSYLFLDEDQGRITLQWDIALKDLERNLGLDQDRDYKLTWGEVENRQADILALATSHLGIRRDGADCLIGFDGLQYDRHSDGGYAVLNLAPDCADSGGPVRINYTLFADSDPTHRGILMDRRGDSRLPPLVLGPDNSTLELLTQQQNRFLVFAKFVKHGIWHISIGFDHLLFLFTLMLPVVLITQSVRELSNNGMQAPILNLIKIVTAFTVAHSITLTLAVLDVVSLPSVFVESAIAMSVLIVALNNVRPVFSHAHIGLVFLFGLLHGFGFAGVLLELDMSLTALGISLFGFNVGVEIGQIVAIVLVFPLLFFLRRYAFYRPLLLRTGSSFVALVAAAWFMERAFGVGIFPVY